MKQRKPHTVPCCPSDRMGPALLVNTSVFKEVPFFQFILKRTCVLWKWTQKRVLLVWDGLRVWYVITPDTTQLFILSAESWDFSFLVAYQISIRYFSWLLTATYHHPPSLHSFRNVKYVLKGTRLHNNTLGEGAQLQLRRAPGGGGEIWCQARWTLHWYSL